MKPTLRNRASRVWMTPGQPNLQFLGMAEFCIFLEQWFHYNVKPSNHYKAIEIGSHTGEGLAMIASTHLFDKIHVIEPFSGDEEFNKLYDWDWGDVRREWQTNTRLFKDFIQLHRGFSHEKVDKFKDESMDLVYIDAEHDYDSVKRDIELYLPKIKHKGILAGHDYHHVWPGVLKAVEETVGEPDKVFRDTTWVKIIDRNV